MNRYIKATCSMLLTMSLLSTSAFAFKDDTFSKYKVPTSTEHMTYMTLLESHDRWSDTMESYLINNNDGTISAVSCDKNVVYIETYDSNTFNLINKLEIPYELDLFGGFYVGEDYNYIVFGQNNLEEDDTKEVLRVVKYDKEFNRIDSCSIQDCYTTKPFDAGSLRMAEHNDTLVIHTSRERYLTEDGFHHQSQLTVVLDTELMEVQNYLGRFQENHVSHSFNQFVQFDGNKHLLLDHGDAYPREVVIHKGNIDNYEMITLFKIPGACGANCTGVTVGGFEVSENNYIAAINTVDHSKITEYTNFTMEGLDVQERDIVLCIIGHDTYDEEHIYLTDLVGTNQSAGVPYLVKLDDNTFAVLWQLFDNSKLQGVYWAIVDEYGKILRNPELIPDAILSGDCQPIVSNNQIIWYVDDMDSRTFYEIDLTDNSEKIIFTIDDPIVNVFGDVMECDVAPIIKHDRTLLPARYVAEALGATVDWDGEKREVRIESEDKEILLYIDSNIAYVNGDSVELDSPAIIDNDRTYTPVRFIAETLGAEVYWKSNTRNVVIKNG